MPLPNLSSLAIVIEKVRGLPGSSVDDVSAALVEALLKSEDVHTAAELRMAFHTDAVVRDAEISRVLGGETNDVTFEFFVQCVEYVHARIPAHRAVFGGVVSPVLKRPKFHNSLGHLVLDYLASSSSSATSGPPFVLTVRTHVATLGKLSSLASVVGGLCKPSA